MFSGGIPNSSVVSRRAVSRIAVVEKGIELAAGKTDLAALTDGGGPFLEEQVAFLIDKDKGHKDRSN